MTKCHFAGVLPGLLEEVSISMNRCEQLSCKRSRRFKAMEVVPGNFASKQRKLQHEQTRHLFPPIFTTVESRTSSRRHRIADSACNRWVRSDDSSLQFPTCLSAPVVSQDSYSYSCPTPLPRAGQGSKGISVPQITEEEGISRCGSWEGSATRKQTGVSEIK